MSYGRPCLKVQESLNNLTAKRLFAVLEKSNLMAPSDRGEGIRYLNKTREDSNRIIKVISYQCYHNYMFYVVTDFSS
jgi:hypothetical protein